MLGATAVKARYDLIDKLSGQTWTKLALLVLAGLASAAHEDESNNFFLFGVCV